MKVELMGYGTYEYTCLKGCDCYFCYLMNRPELTGDEQTRKNGWTENELKYLAENFDKQPVNVTCFELNKTKGAIFTKICELKKTISGIKSPPRTLGYGQQIKYRPNKSQIKHTGY